MPSVCVAYATTYGSTREVAKAVAAVLEERGIRTEVWPAAEVATLEGFSAVVLGGALYFFRFHRDARRFLSRHRRALDSMPVAVFALGPINDTAEEFEGASSQVARALGKQGWLTPTSVKVFGGKVEPAGLRFPHNNPAMKSMPASDIRDWDEVRAWAEALPEALGLDLPGQPGSFRVGTTAARR